ncbi:proline-rich protein 5-like isoform X1 [Cuculus canorus]|uniref:proline-rich protein 5-like isoform X1 n=2 Tax=Cuculus canorus TaxID=55661 RepID=UPI0023AAA97C|nr:proline-rich protein 5-like isoform X1 [Cuculus canorus]XP_053922885.1 proline-rich protein 5-like isoform X1 [Cuculus canorus]XP_053922886.1 proline-rich protein 5-like isoform X1 [Cuculus canorus]XP_053922887.1 proline-rich protein 5-like isoform X1 [Cuculus canorus]XP_053922888.1 proline-rich protein 5-like isoform X1 [Cuculus canorus]XP_053922889.1 proline-rich protein 5-like isoform X1 [Cuculus canorus]
MLRFPQKFHKMSSFRRPRPRFMSSPVLSDLPRFQATQQALQLSSNSAWNSVQTAVINVFKGGGLQNNELYILNENIRQLLKSELGSFITDYFQNQLLAKGLLFIEEKVKLCEGGDRVDVLSEIWDHYFTETLPTLQAIFYPIQGQEMTIRQIVLLGFRDLVLLKIKLEESLPLVQTKLPASIVQMLLILQSVHEPTGPSEGYLQLEELVKQVVSPYLGLYEDRSFSSSTCLLESRYSRSHPKTGVLNYPSHMMTSRQPSEMALTPLTEQEGETYLEKCGSIRRHTVANAHSDIQLLAMASMMHTGMVVEESDITDKCLLLQPSFSQRQCSSEPSIADGPEGVLAAGREDPGELNCTLVS